MCVWRQALSFASPRAILNVLLPPEKPTAALDEDRCAFLLIEINVP